MEHWREIVVSTSNERSKSFAMKELVLLIEKLPETLAH